MSVKPFYAQKSSQIKEQACESFKQIQTKMFITYFIFQLDNDGRTPDTKNSTEEDYNQDVAGIRRAALPANIFLNPNQQCFLQYFLNGQPPVNLRIATLPDMRYICQQLPNNPGTYYYASMHDEGAGIPVYSAYVLNAGNINFQAQAAPGWIQTPGNLVTCTLKLK